MKKLLSVLLILVMAVSMCACGGDDPSEDSTSVKLGIGDSVQNALYEMTLTNLQFSEQYKNTLGDDYMTPTTGEPKYITSTTFEKFENPGVAEDGKVFLVYEFQLNYIGKKDAKCSLEEMFQLSYGDGYTFEVEGQYLLKDGKWIYVDGTSVNHQYVDFEALDHNTYILRGVFEVPEEVEVYTVEELNLIVNYTDGVYGVRDIQ